MKLVPENINEVQKFERGKNPKAAMNLGGINFIDDLNKRLEEWYDFLKTMEGRTIIADIIRFNSDHSGQEMEGATVKIKRLDKPFMLGGSGNGIRYSSMPIYFFDDNDQRCKMDLNQRIRFQD